jgi:uroporphyrinogen-III synthase
MPEEFVGRKIAEAFTKHGSIENSKICQLRAENANRDLPDALEEMGAIVDTSAFTKPSPKPEIFLARQKNFWRMARTESRSRAARPWNFPTRGLFCQGC